ncbi:NACHT, LRR and PYD domains-containing protein 12-like [Engraulis encrasicolus]|uniref:NACHT, LRR and PYD domains-containing protein 12-like n=1 Tax=Engraulis encrasicolus TaxID=184585 RepID=UPI002FD7445A
MVTDLFQHGKFQKFQQELKERLSKKFKEVEPIEESGKPASLAKIYTELYITEGECVEVSTEHEVRQIEMASKKKTTNEETKIECTDIFKPLPGKDKDIRTVMTNGVAGIGKTVSVQKFILDWAEGKANQDIDFLFPVPFREMNSIKNKKYTLMDFIHNFFSEKGDLTFSNDDKIAFIFDGLDEIRLPLDFKNNECFCNISEPASVDALLTNLIKGDLLPSAQIWITSRPAAASQIPPQCVDKLTEVRGFTDPQKEEYFEKNTDNLKTASRIIAHLKKKSSRSLYIMCHIPVFCWMAVTVLVSILNEDKSDEMPVSLTQMYIRFLIIHAKHIIQKYKDKDIWNKKTVLSLGRLAFQQLEKGNLIFYEKDLRECGMDTEKVPIYTGVCTQIFRQESGQDQEKVFCFVHLSIQEFFAALYVFLNFRSTSVFLKFFRRPRSTSQLQSLFSAISLHGLHQTAVKLALKNENGHLDLFLRFLLGLSLESNQKRLEDLLPQEGRRSLDTKKTVTYIKKKIREAPNPERCVNLFHCLNELNDQSLMEEVQGYLQKAKEEREDLCLSQLSALAFVMLMSEQDVEEFDLWEYGSNARSDAGLLRMLPVVKISRTAKLEYCDLSDSSCSSLAAALRSNSSNLRHLDLTGNKQLGDSGVKLLSTGLEHPNCSLETLELQYCNLSDNSCSYLAAALRSNSSSLRHLNLSWNKQLGDSGVKLLSTGLEHPNCRLETLELRGCNLPDSSCSSLAAALSSNSSSLRHLDLSRNERLGDSGVKLLSTGLEHPNCRLETLNLLACDLPDSSCSSLAAALRSNSSSLRHLHLSRNTQLVDSGVKLLCTGLEHPNCRLETLDLWDCDLSDSSCSSLAAALRSNSSSLRHLHLSRNTQLGDSGVKLLSTGLEHPNCRLETLELWSCNLPDSSCSSLAAALRSNSSSLRHLNLSRNEQLGDSGVKLLSTGLDHPNCTLETLRLQLCDLTESSCSSLAAALRSNSSSLRHLDLSKNTRLGNSGVNLLSTGLEHPNCRLETLKLRHCNLPDSSCSSLAASLRSNSSSLRHLDLSWNKQLGGSGVKMLSTGLQHPNCRLETLKLQYCNLSDSSCSSLAAALRSNSSSLRHLYLSGNTRLGDSGVKLLSTGLEHPNCRLETLK